METALATGGVSQVVPGPQAEAVEVEVEGGREEERVETGRDVRAGKEEEEGRAAIVTPVDCGT